MSENKAIVVKAGNTDLFMAEGLDTELKITDRYRCLSVGEQTYDIDEVDVTDLDSTAKDSDAGLGDEGSIAVVQRITKDELAKQRALKGKYVSFGLAARNKEDVAVVGLGGNGWVKTVAFNGFTVGGLLEVTTTIRIKGSLGEFVPPVAPVEP